MLSWFVGDAKGYPPWRVGHPDQYVVVIDRVARLADIPTDAAGRPYLAVEVPTRRLLHRADCVTVAGLAADEIRICGPHDELVASFEGDDLPRCAGCLHPEPAA